MQKILYEAQYYIALSENAITDIIRNNYINSLDNYESNIINIFHSILKILIQNIKNNNLTKKISISILENEFNKMNLSKNLGNFLDYTDFINLLFTRAEEPVRVNSLTNFKEYISAADNLKNNSIKIGIYYSILSKMVYTRSFLEDLEFSKKLTNFLNNTQELDSNSQLFSSLVNESLEFYYRK